MAAKGMTPYMVQTAKWSVMWIAKGRVIEKKFGVELTEAMAFRDRVKDAGRPAVTLRCCNVGHPPPRQYTHAEREVIVRKKVKRGPHKGKTVRVRTTEVYDMMPELNREGTFWCPYCMKMRKFRTIKGRKEVLVQCPMCKITSRDFHVRRSNPQALYLSYHRKVRSRRPKEKSGRRRRNSRKR